MLPPLVDEYALADWLGVTINGGDPRAVAILSAASALVRSETGQSWAEGDALLDVPSDIAGVVVAMAGRVWSSPPTGEVQWNKGPFGGRVLDAVALGLFLTDPEKAVLARYRTKGRHGVYAIATTRNDAEAEELLWTAYGPHRWHVAEDSWTLLR